jgi:iron complex transport system substrate-binding protein
VIRVVSLVPGATEALFALGLGPQVVGVTHECDHPPAALALPRVTRSNLALDGRDGREIDAAVNAALVAGQPLYSVDLEAIRRLEPDLVVAQDAATCARWRPTTCDWRASACSASTPTRSRT